MLQQALEYVAEHADLLVGIIVGGIQEEIGDTAQRFHPSCDRAVRQRGLQLIEQV